jgi:hypothetical protein
MGKIPKIDYKLDRETIDPDFAEGYFGEKIGRKKLIGIYNISEEIKKEEDIEEIAKKLYKEMKIDNSKNNLKR